MTTDEEYPATTNMADDEDAQPVEPQPVEPCGVCGRKFNLSSLSKHERICERTAAKRRKPFDSAKQRIQGTELAEFLPKLRGQTDSSSLGHLGTTSGSLQHSHHHHRHEHHQHSLGRRSSSTGGVSGHRGSSDQGQRTGDAWKQTHDEFLQAIRAARGDNSTVQHQPTSHQQNGAMSNGHHQQPHQPQSSHNGQQHQRPTTLSLQVQTQGVPTRPNEKGQCPTCHRLFGVKSYERHVAFCKERSTRVPASPLLGNNLVAKERLDARMKYRAPGLKNRRPTNREKYSPGNNTLTKTRTLTKEPSGTSSAPDSTARVDNSPKLPILKRQIHSSKESLVGGATNPGPLKSRPMDRSNRLSESQESLNTPALRQLFASRRLLLLSEVLPSKIIKSKTTATVTNSSMKPAVKVVTQFVRKNTSDFNAKVRMKKKIKEREVHDQEDEDDEPIDIAWKERVESGTSESIDKEEEPILSQVSIASDTHKTILHDHDSDNDTVKYESDGDELNRTYELIEGSESLEKELNECIIDVNNDCTNVVYENYRVCTHISEEEEVEKSSDSGKSEACKLGNLPAILGKSFEKSEEPSRKNKTLVKPRKCQSLPNVEEVGMITPRIQEDASPEKVETTSDSKEKRCATYVKEPKPAEDIPAPMKPTASPVIDGEEKWHLHRCERMNHQSSEEVLEFYKNEAASNEFSDVGSVGTVDPPSIEYDTDYVLETDSNASDLIKEIDSSNYDGTSFNTFLNSFSSGSQFDYCVRGANRFEVVRDKRHQGNPRMHARSSGSFLEESSSSTIEAESPRRNKQHYEKEICTITRLDREDEILLPSIGWRSHHEYHREKLVKARPQDYNRQCGTLRRTHDKRSSHNNGHIQNNGRPKNRVQCSDDDADLSSPESLKGKECAPKLSADSAYSSLNRKYSAHGRSANDAAKLKLSRFCHECGFKFPDSAKFCCECGVKRLTI